VKGVEETWGEAADGTAFSRESLLVRGARLPEDEEAALRLMDRLYYAWIPRLTGGTVEMVEGKDGGLRARVVPIGPVGLALGPPRLSKGRIERPVLSGWLVAAGSGSLGQELVGREDGVEIAVSLQGFKPRLFLLPHELHDMTQARMHRRLSRAYLRHDVAPRLRSLACSSSTRTRTSPRGSSITTVPT
jgi:hypothetical protein